MGSQSYKTLIADDSKKGILTVTLNRPERRNAFNARLIEELHAVFTQDVLKKPIRLVILKGKGPVFCAGGDLNWMRDSVELSYEKNLEDTTKLTKMFSVLNEYPVPVLGSIHGAAIGGGVGLVSICDIVLCSQETVFSLSEVRLGLIPACIGPFVLSKIGASACRSLFLSAERFSAAKAQEIGLVHEVLDGPKELEKRIEALAKNILQAGPQALKKAKELVLKLSIPEYRSNLKDSLNFSAEMLAKLRIGEEGQEGVRAFLEKRKPKWG